MSISKRIAALIFIFFCTSAAWFILGATIFARSDSEGPSLKQRVGSIWGTPQTQLPPSATFNRDSWLEEEKIVDGKVVKTKNRKSETIDLPLTKSGVQVGFDLEHRQKGLMWYSTYKVNFAGDYAFTNTSQAEELITLHFPLPAEKAVYDDFKITLNGEKAPVRIFPRWALADVRVAPGATIQCRASYKSQGLDQWVYSFGNDVQQVHDFRLVMDTNFRDIDFPDNSLSPTEKRQTPGGWQLEWKYDNLLSGFQIAMQMPEKLQPGPLAGKISFFAPVSLFFFFFLIFIITVLRDIDLHPMNYFFLAAAFFAFHLLLAYLADQISIHLAFAICSLMSIFLVVSYLRLVVGMRFAAVEAGISQLVYLVLFSYAFFFKGFTGLAITIGSILTLFAVMQMTGRINWTEKFGKMPRKQL